MTIYALCPSTKSMKAIDSGAQLKRVYGEKGSTIFINGYSKNCKNKSGEPVRMSRILKKEKKFKLRKCADPLVRNPLTRRCDSKEYKEKFVKSLLTKSIADIKKLGSHQYSAMIPNSHKKAGSRKSPKSAMYY